MDKIEVKSTTGENKMTKEDNELDKIRFEENLKKLHSRKVRKYLRVCKRCEGTFVFGLAAISRGQTSPCCYRAKNIDRDLFIVAFNRSPKGPISETAKLQVTK